MKHLSSSVTRWLLAAVLVGCSAQGGSGGPTTCSPGATTACVCAGQPAGVQTCGADMLFGPCVCGATDSGTTDVTATDTGTPPDRVEPMDTPAVDNPPPRDVPPARDIPATFDTGPQDTGSMRGICPASCGFNGDCDPCWGPGETRTGSYCCTSGMCIYAPDRCGATATDGGPTGIPDASLSDTAGLDVGTGGG